MSIKEQLYEARKLIQEKQYEEARDLLETIDHPKAKEWLGQLNVRLAQRASTQSARKSPSSKPAKKTKAKSSRSNYLIPVVAMVLLLVVVGVVAVVVLPGLNNVATVATGEPQAVVNDDSDDNGNDASTSDTDSNENDEDTTDDISTTTSSGDIVGSGVRTLLPDDGTYLFNVELPDGYTCECDISSNQVYGEDSSTNFRIQFAQRAFDPDYYLDKTIDEMLANDIREDETLAGQETMQVNGRDVVIARVADEDNDVEISYNVKDSDGHIVRVIIPSYINDPETLHEAAMFVAGNVEGELGEAVEEFFTAMTSERVSYDEATDTWFFADLDSAKLNSIMVLEGWTFESGIVPTLVKDGDRDTSATSITSQSRKVFLDDGETLLQWVTAFYANSGEDVESEEVVTVGDNREVVIRQEYDGDVDQRTLNFYFVDSDGDFMVAIVQPFVENPAVHREDILAMIATVESEDVRWEDQLRRAGYGD